MRTASLFATAIAVLIAARTAPADEKDKKDAEVEKALSKIAQLGPGVHAIKKDKQGRITSCIVVGQARISTVLGKPKGLQDARDKARLDASAQFVKWLKEKVSVHEKGENETILFIEGSEDNDKAALKESGKAVEKSTKKFESISEGMVRGLQVLHLEVSDKDRTYTLLMGWSADNAKAAEKVGNGEVGTRLKDGGSKKAEESRRPSDRKIEDRKVTSDDAKKFLPDK